jgi:UDP-N-acetylmuramyl pentapeptide phosphotransferase/UDP-N-acetylglucosamine-1-phosphate transferase
MSLLINPIIIGLLCLLLFAFLLSVFLIPVIKILALSKGIVAIPINRSSHSKITPALGGLAIYLSSLISIFITSIIFDFKIELFTTFYIGVATLIMIILGMIDDMFYVKPYLKLLIQSIAASIIIESLGPDLMVYITDGLKNGLGVLSYAFELSYLLAILIIIVFINMINMIDGIDGLAASLFLISCVFFSVTSILSGNLFSSLLSFSGIGSLIPFLYHNLLSKDKIFLGDNGSLLIGCILAYLSLDFVSNNSINLLHLNNNKFPLLLSLYLYPLTDFLRIITVRIFKLRNPLKADKNHIHHNLIRSGLSHISSTIVISIFTILITFITSTLINQKIYIPLLFLSSMSLIVAFLPKYLPKIRKFRS